MVKSGQQNDLVKFRKRSQFVSVMQVKVATVAMYTWVLVFAMQRYIHLGVNSHTGDSTQGANSIIGY